LQRQNADITKQLQQREAEIATLRSLAQQGPVQGAAQGQKSSGPPSFADELANSGELELFAKIAQDPEMGMGHAMYAMAQAFDKRLTSAMEQVQSETIQPLIRRQDGAEKMARVFSTVKEMSSDFPELVDYGENTPEDIAEAQQTILGMLEQLPPEWLANKPKDALWYAVTKYREMHGTPQFAQPPGTSESPSALVAAAAEKAAKASSATPLDGSGVPRQGSKGPETPADKWRRESSQLRKEATTPSGRKLGFAEPV
jgi:hypothetical protein